MCSVPFIARKAKKKPPTTAGGSARKSSLELQLELGGEYATVAVVDVEVRVLVIVLDDLVEHLDVRVVAGLVAGAQVDEGLRRLHAPPAEAGDVVLGPLIPEKDIARRADTCVDADPVVRDLVVLAQTAVIGGIA